MILAAGCSGEYKMAPVSGTVTFDGEPLEGAEVVFAPMESDGVLKVGPCSVGVTDNEGKYILKTPKGAAGAVVTNHRVSVGFGEPDEAAIAAIVEEAYSKNVNMSEAKVMAIERKARRSMAVRSIPDSYNSNTQLRITVTGPNSDANFDLSSDGTLPDFTNSSDLE